LPNINVDQKVRVLISQLATTIMNDQASVEYLAAVGELLGELSFLITELAIGLDKKRPTNPPPPSFGW
jgi:hypothetical protein